MSGNPTCGDARLPFISGTTAIQGHDGGSYCYLDLVAFMEEAGTKPDGDIHELWRRILFSCAIGNTDDHMRNHGFLREKNGWRLSPAFDVNPTPGDNPKYLHNAIDFDIGDAHPHAAISACEWFRLSRDEARSEARRMAKVLKSWPKAASRNGISKASCAHMASCLDAGVERLLSAR